MVQRLGAEMLQASAYFIKLHTEGVS